MEECIARFVGYQIRKKRIEQSEAEVYEYGYRLFMEKLCAVIMTFLLAFVFDAWKQIFIFCFAFIPVRTYAGGYHARRSLSCMVLSAGVLIMNVLIGKWVMETGYADYVLCLEIILYPVIAFMSPVENSNRTISDSERKYFKRMVIVLYAVQILVEVFLMWLGRTDMIASIVLAHVSVMGSLVVG